MKVVSGGDGFFHQAPDQYKLQAGWQEPGLWRPKWIMDRVFDAEVEEGEVAVDDHDEEAGAGGKGEPGPKRGQLSSVKIGTRKRKGNSQGPRVDRVYLKLKSDRTVKVFKSSNRPLLEIVKKKEKTEKKKNLFESGNEEMASFEDQINAGAAKVDESFFEVDGTWWFQDAAPLNQGKVKIETREGKDHHKLRHDVRCDWGTMDGYAAKFRTGKIVKYKMGLDSLGMPLPIGEEVVGSFTLRVSPHRPLVSKDYVAFQ